MLTAMRRDFATMEKSLDSLNSSFTKDIAELKQIVEKSAAQI